MKRAGFENITIDLIYALPGQTMEMVKSDVDKFLALDLPHVALYSLILEDHTVFMNRQRRGLYACQAKIRMQICMNISWIS